MEARPVLVVRDIGSRDDPYWLAATDDGHVPLLETGESMLWRGFAQVRQKSPTNWELEGMGIVVTDRRLIFLTTGFDKGGGFSGFGAVTLVAAAGLNAVSRHQARKRSAGKVAIGHLRHEWVRDLSLRRRKVLIGGPDVAVVLSALTGGPAQVVELKGPSTREEFGGWLAGVVSRHRLATDSTLDERERALLTRQADGPGRPAPQYGDGSIEWAFPVRTPSGTPVAPAASTAVGGGDGAACPRCGERAAPGQRFCTACGVPLTPAVTGVRTEPA